MTQIIRRAILAFALIAGITPAFAQAPPPVPALPDTERRTTYVLSGTTCACAVNFALYGDSTDYQNWIEVWVNGVNVAYNDPVSGWTLTVPSGSLSTRARPITDAVLTFNAVQTGTVQIVGARRPRRVAQFAENRGVAARDLNQALTDIVAQNRETWDRTNDLTGRTARVPPGETMATLPKLSGRASMNACFDANGNLTSCVGSSSGSFAAGAGIVFTGTNPTTISTTANSNAGMAFVSSRTIAQTLDLHTFSVVRTGGYGSGGDGGGATFRNVGTTPFKDVIFGTGYGGFTISNAGSGLVPGVYRGVPFTGSATGTNCQGQVTVGGGGTVTDVQIAVPCVNYQINDVITTPIAFIGGGGGTAFQLTVTALHGPLASFTDSSGAHMQYIVDAASGPVNILQFGAIADWQAGASSATNNTLSIQLALSFASLSDGHSPGNGGIAGQHVRAPFGAFMFCDNNGSATTAVGLVVPLGVWFSGDGVMSTILHYCSPSGAGNGNVNPITLCDTLALVGQFGCRLTDMSLEDASASASAGTAVIFSNSGQQQTLAENLLINSKVRGCVWYEFGWGGAANSIWKDIDCEFQAGNTSNGYRLNAPTTQHTFMGGIVFGCPSGCTGAAFSNTGGDLNTSAASVDIEGFATGLIQNVTVAGKQSVFKNVQQSLCTGSAVQLVNGNIPGNLIMENIQTNCGTVVLNGQPGGLNWAAQIRGALMCVAGACAAAVP